MQDDFHWDTLPRLTLFIALTVSGAPIAPLDMSPKDNFCTGEYHEQVQ